MLNYPAPAKINLVLEVLGKRDDGYHEIRSLVQTISLCDVISFERADVISLECTEPSLLTFENLVVQAAELSKMTSGYEKGVKIKLEKKIPCSGGRRHTRFKCDWSSDVCSSDLSAFLPPRAAWMTTATNSSCEKPNRNAP